MARHFRGSGHIVRFIEFMDVGHTNGWQMEDVVPSRELVAMIDREFRSSRSIPITSAKSPSAGATRTAAARSASSPRSRRRSARLHARPSLRRGPALHLPVRDPRHRPAQPASAAGAADEEISARHRHSLARPRRSLLGDPHRRRARSCARSRCPTSAVEPGLRSCGNPEDPARTRRRRRLRTGFAAGRVGARAHSLVPHAGHRHRTSARRQCAWAHSRGRHRFTDQRAGP